MKLKDIYLGTTDAKNEMLSNTPEEIERFKKLFVVPPALLIDKYFNRDKYFITGLKGTGKTALLRYISLKLDEKIDNHSRFILFKSDIDEDLRKEFNHANSVEEVIENSQSYDGKDYENIWRWFIYKTISKLIQNDDIDVFQKNENLNKFHATINSEVLEDTRIGFYKLIPKIKKGNIEVSKNPRLSLDLDWDSNGNAKINFARFIRGLDEDFQNLQASEHTLNIFFDELELNYSTTKQYQRDSRLIRDLIVTIEKINAVAKRKGFNICLYAAIRSEVTNSVETLGKEINKPLTDFGTDIFWNRAGYDAIQQPLLHIIEQRVNNARIEHGLPKLESADLWAKYFPKIIHKKKPQTYLLHSSWYRPRDIVRLLISAQDSYPEEEEFNTQTLEAVRKKYSSLSWTELTEELKTKYKSNEIEGIKNILYGFKQISTVDEFTRHAEGLKVIHEDVKQVLEKTTITEILKDLYRIGVIGNFNKPDATNKARMRFSFRGDDNILFTQKIYVHNALLPHLSI